MQAHASIRLADRLLHVSVSDDGRLHFASHRALPAAAAYLAVERTRRLWADACRGDAAAQLALPLALRRAARARALDLAVERRLGRGALYQPSTFAGRMITRLQRTVQRLAAGLWHEPTGGSTLDVYPGDEPAVHCLSDTCAPHHAAHVDHPNAYSKRGFRCATVAREITAPVTALLYLRAERGALVLSPTHRVVASRGSRVRLSVRGPRGTWS